MPSNCRNLIKDTLADWKPMKGIPHEFISVAELGDTTNQSSSGSAVHHPKVASEHKGGQDKEKSMIGLWVNGDAW